MADYSLNYQVPSMDFSMYDPGAATSAGTPNIMGIAGVGADLMGVIGDIFVDRENERARKAVLDSNARINDMLARDAKRRGQEEVARFRAAGKKRVGSARAALAAQGIRLTGGDVSAGDVVQEELDLIELNALTIVNNASREALGYQVRAGAIRMESRMESIRGGARRTERALTGISRGIGYYERWKSGR